MTPIAANQVFQSTPDTTKADELINKFYATREKAPVFNQDKSDRIQRMGRINQLGKGLGVVGDIISTGFGGNVKRRQPDTTAPALYNAFQSNLDKYEADKQAYDFRDFQKRLKDTQLGISRADKETEQAYRDRVQTSREKAAIDKATLDASKYATEKGFKENEEARKKKADETDAAYKKRMAYISESRAKAYANKKTSSTTKPYMQVGDQDITEGEARVLYEKALKYFKEQNPDSNDPYFKAMMGSFENQPVETKKEIIAKYLIDQGNAVSGTSLPGLSKSVNKKGTFQFPGLGKK